MLDKKFGEGYFADLDDIEDQFLFHRMNNKGSIFTSGKATRENTAFGVHE